jgi:hypothetical protein
VIILSVTFISVFVLCIVVALQCFTVAFYAVFYIDLLELFDDIAASFNYFSKYAETVLLAWFSTF